MAELHFILLPFMAQSHTIPIIEIAKLLASRGVTVTLLLTRLNHERFKPAISRANEIGLSIRVQELIFPGMEVGLPPDCESFEALPSNSLAPNFMFATALLEAQVKTLLMTMSPKPSSLIADMCHTYASNVAKKVGIPRILFHGIGAFPLLCTHQIFKSKILENVSDHTFDVPDIPDKISMTMSQIRPPLPIYEGWKQFNQMLSDDEKGSFGVVFNSFVELEPAYVRQCENVKEMKVWCVGPVWLCNKVSRDNTDETECLKWLDSCEPSSVIYACLGTLCNLPAAQLLEIGLGLEASGRPFIWVVKSARLKELMIETGLDERFKKSSKGLVIWGWAPQLLILSHPAVGGFLTHCGWNSVLEGISSGLPMLTWPMVPEQFYNEKLIVDVLRIGVQIGIKKTTHFFGNVEDEEVGVDVSWERIKEGVEELMDDGEVGKERMKRAKELANKAMRAVEEGGSSYVSIGKLIEDVRNFTP